MRIGIFTDSYVPRPDGIAIAVDTIREALAQEHQEVFIFCPSRPGVKYTQSSVITYPSLPAFIYEGLRAAWPFGQGKLERIKKLNLDIIHIHLPFNMGFAGLRAAKKFSIPVVMSCHQDMDYVKDYPGSFLLGVMIIIPTAIITRQYKQALSAVFSKRVDPTIPRRYDFIRRAYCFLTDQCDLAIAPSHKIYEQLMPYSTKKNFVIVPNVIDPRQLPVGLNRAQARASLGINQQTAMLITTSRLVREKRIDKVIEGFAILKRKRPNTELFIIGGGPSQAPLERQAADLGLQDSVHFVGWQPHLKVFRYLAAADLYANPCMREIMSLSALEAAAMGKPLLLFDERLIEIVGQGKNGYFVRSPKQMAEKAEAILSDTKLAHRLGRASKKRVVGTYNLQQHGKNLLSAYSKIVRAD